MADISKEIQKFKSAVYGEEVRGAMIDLANAVNEDAERAKTDFEHLVELFNNLNEKIYGENGDIKNIIANQIHMSTSITNNKNGLDDVSDYIKILENGLNGLGTPVLLEWKYGYINGSDGNENESTNPGNPNRFAFINGKKDTVIRFLYNGACYIYKYINGEYDKRIAFLGYGGTYRLNDDEELKISVQLQQEDATERFDVNKYVEIVVDKKFQEADRKNERIMITPSWNRGLIWNEGGAVGENDSYRYSDLIEIPANTKIIYTYSGSKNIGAVIEYSKTGQFLKTIIKGNDHASDGKTDTITHIFSKKTYIRLCHYYQNGYKLDAYRLIGFDNSVYRFSFDNIICIGDSVTEGAYPNDEGVYEKGYPYFLQKLTNVNVVNAGASGATTSQYWGFLQSGVDITFAGATGYERHRVIPSNFSNYDAVFMCLGHNDGLTDTLEEDVNKYSSYTNYANTNTGCYCKIIEKIRNDNPNSKIFLIGIAQNKDAEFFSGVNDVIKKIAKKYDLPYIDVFNNSRMNVDNIDVYHYPNSGWHFNKIGYMTLANDILSLVENAIAERPMEYIY